MFIADPKNHYKDLASGLIKGKSYQLDRLDSTEITDFIRFSENQGVLCLFDNSLAQIEGQCPDHLIKSIVIAQASFKKLLYSRSIVIKKLFDGLGHIKVKSVLFKGAANAYLLYPKPELRQHADIDVLIDANDYDLVIDVLIAEGFDIDPIKPTKFGPYQTTAKLKQPGQPNVMVDLHWKINNRLLLADVIALADVWEDALPIEQYGEHAYGFDFEHALLACCIHEAGSLAVERGKLIGLYDAYLLADKLGDTGLSNVLEKASTKNILTICKDYLRMSISMFGNEGQIETLEELISSMPKGTKEPSSGLLKTQRTWLDEQILDWQGVNGISNKTEYLVSKLVRKLKFR